MSEPTETDWVEYGRYSDAMAGKPFPHVTFTEWTRREETLRGDQLTLQPDEVASGADT